ncbi:phasin family protein [Sphingomonas sp. 28-63-12]|uniref:phasin family protein n=1 Tax=Sphingomonas sp. 28-63-12 TaxID=1970434 RepID=UPI000BC6E28B|nr:MAG: hypothetical protein B7Y47_07260 [Sphingomonas sp. 28-63-12]
MADNDTKDSAKTNPVNASAKLAKPVSLEKVVAPVATAATKIAAPMPAAAPAVAVTAGATPAPAIVPATPVAAKPVPATPVAQPPVAAAAAPVKKPAPVMPAPAKAATVKAAVKTEAKTQAPPIAARAPAAPLVKKENVTMESTVKKTAEKAQTMFVEMNDRAKAALEKTQGMFADMNDFNKGNVEAIVESSKIAAKGIESMGQEAAEYTRKSFEGMTAIVKSMASVKSPTEFMKLHSDYVRTSFDSMVAESSKNTEALLKLAGEIAQPISNRVAVAAEKIKITA